MCFSLLPLAVWQGPLPLGQTPRLKRRQTSSMMEGCLGCLGCWLAGCWLELWGLAVLLLPSPLPLVFCFFLLGPPPPGLMFSLLAPAVLLEMEGPAQTAHTPARSLVDRKSVLALHLSPFWLKT